MLTIYLLAWIALAAIGTLNGILREATYGKKVSELTAHQISTLTGILFSGLFVWGLNQIWPLESERQAWSVGICWFLLTVAFEFGFGHFVFGNSWGRLFADYNILQGRVWSLFLLWTLFLPIIIFRI